LAQGSNDFWEARPLLWSSGINIVSSVVCNEEYHIDTPGKERGEDGVLWER